MAGTEITSRISNKYLNPENQNSVNQIQNTVTPGSIRPDIFVKQNMSPEKKNKIKALILMLVFSMNSLAGFACSIGINMGYNSHHHTHTKINAHKKCPGHQKPSGATIITVTSLYNISNDDCCTNAVTKFNILDKLVVENSFQSQPQLFPIPYLSAFFQLTGSPIVVHVNAWFQFVRRSCSLDDTDIRIAIQSFQI